MSGEQLLLKREGAVATITFNRPKVRNAMNPAMRDGLLATLDELAADSDIHVVLLQGAGGYFIAGGDLKVFAQTLDLDREARREDYRDRVKLSSQLVLRLVNYPKTLVAVIEGDAAGAGISIALCCDFVVATQQARFSFAHAHVGLALDLGMSYFLPRAVGRLQANRLAMLGKQISAAEAHSLGLTTALVSEGELEEAVQELLADLGKMPATAVAAIKREFRGAEGQALEAQLMLEADAVADCAATEAFEQRVAAFARR